jgi:hypothetical protein
MQKMVALTLPYEQRQNPFRNIEKCYKTCTKTEKQTSLIHNDEENQPRVDKGPFRFYYEYLCYPG